MKATDLMIGDWVMFDNELLQVSEILKDGICANNDTAFGFYPFEHLEPIPLTKDILRKNEFKQEQVEDEIIRYERWEYKTPSEIIAVLFDTLKKDYHLVTSYNLIWNIVNVHELQHDLRISRIEKEIKL